eukprot:5458502-Prorocentrum_lima.AAC.1
MAPRSCLEKVGSAALQTEAPCFGLGAAYGESAAEGARAPVASSPLAPMCGVTEPWAEARRTP